MTNADDWVEFGTALQALDYRFVTVTPATHQRVNARPENQWARNLSDIFGWSRPFKDLKLIEPWLPLLTRAELIEACPGGWRATARVSTIDASLFFHSPYPTMAQDSVFFGPDTWRFVRALQRALGARQLPIRRAVDIGCGAGPAAIEIARHHPGAEVIAVDINEAALTMTAINATLARTPNVITRNSNLLQDLDGNFDLIVSNPPYLLDANERAYRHGGGELGAGLSLAIVDAALDRLEPGGTLLLYTGVAIVNGKDPFLQAISARLEQACASWTYVELDPDVFGEELDEAQHRGVDRIAVVWLEAVKQRAAGH